LTRGQKEKKTVGRVGETKTQKSQKINKWVQWGGVRSCEGNLVSKKNKKRRKGPIK